MFSRRRSDQPRRPLSRSDILFSRTLGTALLLGAVFLIFTLAFSTFELTVLGFVPSESEIITCPTPWSMLFGDPVFEGALAEPRVSGDPVSPELCIRPSRTLVFEAGLAAVLALPPVVWLLSRRTRPPALPSAPSWHESESRSSEGE